MAVTLLNKVVIEIYKKAQFPNDKKNGELSGADGVWMNAVNIAAKCSIPIKGAIDYNIDNQGSSTAYLFDGAVVIPPGTQWTPTKSTNLPYINEPIITFTGDYQLTRNISNLTSPVTSSF